MTTHAQHDSAAPPAKPRRPLRPYAPRPKPYPFLSIPNRCTRDGRQLRELRADLLRHVGGAPNAPQTILIDRVVMLTWQSMQLDRAAAGAGALQAADMAAASIALLNALGRALVRLGLAPAKASRPSLREYLDRKPQSA